MVVESLLYVTCSENFWGSMFFFFFFLKRRKHVGDIVHFKCLQLYILLFLLLLHFFLCQSLKSRGIRFPGHNNESLNLLFTPPRSVEASESLQLQHEIPAQRFSAEQTMEALDVARNSIELLNTVLSSSPAGDILRVLLLI